MTIYGIPHLRCAFRDYNDSYFGGILPMPEFEITDSFKFFGYFHSGICNGTTVNPLIQISGNWDYTESQFRDILVHEMIHYYLAYTGRDLVGSHGSEFISLAYKLNREHGLNITETINYDEYTRRKGTSILMYWLAKLF